MTSKGIGGLALPVPLFVPYGHWLYRLAKLSHVGQNKGVNAMTKEQLLVLLESVPFDAQIIIHCPQSRVAYPSIRSLELQETMRSEYVEDHYFPPVCILKGVE